MKTILLYCLFFAIHFSLIGQSLPDSGFTNKAEAKNQMVNGKKEGKWVEYHDKNWRVATEQNAKYYSLIIYKAGLPYGIKRTFYMSGKLNEECFYSNGNGNGLVKEYYENGVLASEGNIINGAPDGLYKSFYKSGVLAKEISFRMGVVNGIEKEYYKDGKLKSETIYTNGVVGATKNYDENSNEIK